MSSFSAHIISTMSLFEYVEHYLPHQCVSLLSSNLDKNHNHRNIVCKLKDRIKTPHAIGGDSLFAIVKWVKRTIPSGRNCTFFSPKAALSENQYNILHLNQY